MLQLSCMLYLYVVYIIRIYIYTYRAKGITENLFKANVCVFYCDWEALVVVCLGALSRAAMLKELISFCHRI